MYVTPRIEDLHDPRLAQRLQYKLDRKTKPTGSLGRLEQLALQLGLVLGTESPRLQAAQVLVCAGDHGIAAHGVSAYPSDVTWQMVENFLAGGAAVSVLARQHGLGLTVVDCGVRHEFGERPGLRVCKVAWGTGDALQGPAMQPDQCAEAVENGRRIVASLPGNALLLGEMGIANTSAAALLMARLTGEPLADCVGAGTGLDAAGITRKQAVLQQVLERHGEAREPLAALAAFGGFEIATLVGAVLQAAEDRRVIVVDGFITCAAVLVAKALEPHVLQRCIFSHRSDERGHARMLRHLGPDAVTPARPLLDLGLRLGEGSGAVLAWPLLQSACAILCDMASFESAGVSDRSA